MERIFNNRGQEESNVSNTQEEPSEQDSNNPGCNNTGRVTTKDKYNKGHIVIPYTQGPGETIKKICRKYDIQKHFKGYRTIKDILVKPKDKDPLERKSGTIYRYQFGELACNEHDIGETFRTSGERYKEHLKEHSSIHGHSTQTGHSTNPENFIIIGREDHGLARTIKESIYIRVNKPTLNRNSGNYNLHHIWDRVLFNTPNLKINHDNGHAHRTSFSGHAQSIPTNRQVHRTIGHTGHAQTSEHVHRTP